MEEYAIQCAKWLEKRVQQAEADDPKLRPLKDRINELSNQIKSAEEGAIPELIRQQSVAIQTLINHVASHSVPQK
jgi:hypothetical protein